MVEFTLDYELTNYHLITSFIETPKTLKITGCNAAKVRNGTGPFIKFEQWVNGKLHVGCKTALFDTGTRRKPRQQHIRTPVLELSSADAIKARPTTDCPFSGCVYYQKGACSTSDIRTQ
jgi:hypothetical protein